MSFVYPEFLWALFLLAIPISIHLFSFRRHRIFYFSSLQFVQQIEQQHKSVQKLKHLLVLFCRLFVLTSLIVAFAQPYFPSSVRGTSHSDSILALHIDNSFSMTMKGIEGDLLSEAKETARKLILQAPLSRKIMLSTNVLDGVESRLCSRVEALERLETIEASPMARSYDEVVNWQKNTLKTAYSEQQIQGSQFVYLSDFQKSTQFFADLSSDSSAYYIPICFSSQNKHNLSVDSVWFANPLHKVGENNELFIQIRNHGSVDLQNASIHFESEELKRDLFIDLPKNTSRVTSLSFAPKKNGIHSGKVSISDQHFFADDDYFFSYTVSEHSSILLINGEDAHASMATIYQLDNFYTVHQVDQNSFTMGLLQGTDLVVLNGVNSISSGLSANLLEYAQNSGTIAVFPGKNIQPLLNNFLSQLNLPTLGKVVNQSMRIKKINYKDPFFRGIFEEEKEDLSLPGVNIFYLSNPTNTSLDIIELQNGKTLLYRQQHNYQSFLFTSVLSPDYGTFLNDILYPTMMLRIAELSLLHPPLAVSIGQTDNFPVYYPINTNFPLIIRGEKTEFIPEKRTIGHITSIDLSGTSALTNLRAGFFDLINNQDTVSKLAVNYNRTESLIDTWSESEIKTFLKEAGIRHINVIHVDNTANKVSVSLDKNYPYWKILIFIALFFLLMELLILRFFTVKSKGKSNSQAVKM